MEKKIPDAAWLIKQSRSKLRWKVGGNNTMKAFILLSLLICMICVSCQEPPSLIPSTLDQSFRQSFCDLHQQVESGNLTRRKALEGVELHVALFDYQLNSETRDLPVTPDISMKLLDEIAERGGFTWRNSYGFVSSPSGDESWETVLQYSVDTYDLMLEWYLRLIDRLNSGILFSEGWYDGSLIMVQKKEKDSSDFSLLSFLRPFTLGVWLILLAVTVVSGVVMFILEYADDKQFKQNTKFDMNEAIFAAFFLFVGHFSGDPRSHPTRIMNFSLCFTFLIIMSAYTANLASFLVAKNAAIVNFNTIEDAIRNDLSICVMRSSSADLFLVKKFPTARLLRKDVLEGASYGDAVFEGLLEGDCDIGFVAKDTFETFRRNVEFNPDCNLEFVGREAGFTTGSYTMRDSAEFCTSLLRDVIDLHLIEMKIDGTFDEIWRTHRELTTTNTCLQDDTKGSGDDPRISLKNSGGIFIIHAVVTVIAIGVSFLQKKQKRPSTNKNNTVPEGNMSSEKNYVSRRGRIVRRTSIGRQINALRRMMLRVEEDDFEANPSTNSREDEVHQSTQEEQLKLINNMLSEMASNNQRRQEEWREVREAIKATEEVLEKAILVQKKRQ